MLWLDFGLIAALELLSFGPFILQRGFYTDDWIFLYGSYRAGGFWNGVRAMSHGSFWARPLEILHYPLFYFHGLTPLDAQLVLLGLKIAEGCLLLALFKRLLGRRNLALIAATLGLIYPCRSATHLWYANAPQGVAVVLALISLLGHEAWIRTKRGRWLAVSASLYILSVFSYESTAFIPLVLGAPLLEKSLRERRSFIGTIKELGAVFWPHALALLFAWLWMWLGVRWFAGIDNPKPLHFSLANIGTVYSAALSNLTVDTIDLCARSAPLARKIFRLPAVCLWLAALGACAWSLSLGGPSRPSARPGSRRSAGILAAVIFLAGYLPYGFSIHPYAPEIFGLMNRINEIGAWAAGLALAGLLDLNPVERRAHRAVLLVLILIPFTWTNAVLCRQWAVAWQTELEILDRAAVHARALPASATVILTNAPSHIGGSAVFTESWDFDYALKMKSGREDIRGRVDGPRMKFHDDYVAEAPDAAHWPRTEEWRYPYRDLYVYDHAGNALRKLDGPPR